MADTTEVEETFQTDEQGIAYSSESAPSADAPQRPATIAPANATGRRKEAGARVRPVPAPPPRPPAPGPRPAARQRSRPGLVLPQQAPPAGRERAVRRPAARGPLRRR